MTFYRTRLTFEVAPDRMADAGPRIAGELADLGVSIVDDRVAAHLPAGLPATAHVLEMRTEGPAGLAGEITGAVVRGLGVAAAGETVAEEGGEA